MDMEVILSFNMERRWKYLFTVIFDKMAVVFLGSVPYHLVSIITLISWFIDCQTISTPGIGLPVGCCTLMARGEVVHRQFPWCIRFGAAGWWWCSNIPSDSCSRVGQKESGGKIEVL